MILICCFDNGLLRLTLVFTFLYSPLVLLGLCCCGLGGKHLSAKEKKLPSGKTSSVLHSFSTTLNRSITEFMTIVPAQSEISIITFSKNAVMHLPPTVITDTNRNGIIGR